MFIGTEQSAREVDCVLIYDEDTGVCHLFLYHSSGLLT